MNGSWRRWTKLAGVAVLLAGLGRVAQHFPWKGALQATLDANALLLGIALVVNLASLSAKGWAWQLVLKPVARVGWRAAQAATLAGSAVTDLATSLVGEAARVQVLVRRVGVSWRQALASVIYLRMLEGVGLAVFLIASPLLLPLPPELRAVHAAAAVLLILTALVLLRRPASGLAHRLPQPVRGALATFSELISARALPAPLALVLAGWATQWVTYGLVLRACGVDPAWQASFVALVAANVAGLMAVSPGNVGVFQAAIVLGLLPMGIDAERAIVAGIALQVIQIPPVLALAGAVFGLKGLKQLRAATTPESTAPAERDATVTA